RTQTSDSLGDDGASVAESSKKRKTEAERIKFLQDDFLSGEVEPYRMFCNGCQTWVDLNPKLKYVMQPFRWRTILRLPQISVHNVYAPARALPSAFLDLVGANRDLWTWEPWIDFTGLSDAPWSGKPGSKPKGWTDDDVVSVRAMVNAYWTVAPKDRMVFFKDRQSGAKGKSKASSPLSAADLGVLHTDARNKWSAWFNELGREHLAKLVDDMLMEEGHHPTQLMKANATQKPRW
ncbi:predicted protein, partial [Postia placenta Mad-698-R]